MGVQLSLMEVQATGSDNNSGLFDTQATMTSTLSATSANTASPVVTASNYTFTANDVGHFLYVKPSGTWKCGWYKIASVTSGAATLIASVGSVFGGDKQPNTTVGISINATDSSGTWAVDYTQKNTSLISYTDLVAVTASQLTSAANPFTPNLIGNSIQILSGTGFPPNIYIINSLTGSAANFHINFATPGSTGGTGNLGGALATVHKACGMVGISINYVYVKGSAGAINVSSNAFLLESRHYIIGYQNNRWDNLKATIRLTASGARFLVSGDGKYVYLYNLIIDGQGYSDTRVTSFGNNQRSYVYNCEFRNLTYGLWAQGGFQVDNCIFENITTSPFGYSSGPISRCIFKNCVGNLGASSTVDRCIFYGGTTGILLSNQPGQITNNTFYNISGDAISFYSGYSNVVNASTIYNNLFSNISGYGINYGNNGTQLNISVKNNAFFACTSGNFISALGNNPNSGYIPLYTQIQLSSSPFVNPSAGDFRLNNDLTGGRLCRGSSISSNGVITPNNDALDIGAVQTTSYAADKTLGPLSKTVDMKANTTNYSEYINLASTGYTFNTATLKAYYVRPNLTATSISLASQTVSGTWVSGGFVEVDPINMPGLYRFDIPNEVIASGVSNSMLQVVNTANNDRVNINYKFFDSQILDLTQAVPTANVDQTVGDAFNAARAYGFGKWAINGNWLNYYDTDGITIIKSLYLDNPSYPKSRGYGESTNNLILNLKAYDVNSYAGAGNLWNDLSGSNYDCILYYNPTFVLDAGGAIQFNGSQVGICEFGTNLTFTEFTYNIWVKITQNSAQWQSLLNVNNDTFLLAVYNLGINSYNPTYVAGYNIPLNTWVNVCQTYVQNTSPLIYVNGSLIHTATSSNLSYIGQRFSIGAGVTNIVGPTADEFLYGRISEILIYNKRLSATEIYNNYMAKKYRYGL